MIRINGTSIVEEEIAREAQYHPAESFEAARASAAHALVVRELLLQEARRRGLDASGQQSDGIAEEEALIAALLEDAVTTPEPDEPTCRRYYENNLAKYHSADIFEASHILFPAAANDETARAEAKRRAEATIAELDGELSRFAALARERSACSSAAHGGDLGQLTRGQTAPEFETFLYNVAPGTLCPVPVPTRYGYHVLYLRRRIDGRQLPFDTVKAGIARELKERAWRRATHQLIQLLVDAAEIEGIELAKSGSPLLQ